MTPNKGKRKKQETDIDRLLKQFTEEWYKDRSILMGPSEEDFRRWLTLERIISSSK